MFQQVCRYDIDLPLDKYIEELVAYWGYEFFADEYKSPFSLGGWAPCRYLGVDVSMFYMKGSIQELRAMEACKPLQLRLPQRCPNGGRLYLSPLEQIYGPDLSLNGKEGTFFYRVTRRFLSSRMTRFLRPGDLKRAWETLARERMLAYGKNHQPRLLNKSEWYEAYTSIHPDRDVLPDGIFPEESIFKFPRLPGRPWKSKTPYLSFIAFWNPDKVKDTVIPCPSHPGAVRELDRLLTAEERRSATEFISVLSNENGLRPLFLAPPERFIPNGEWLDTPSVCAAYEALTGRKVIPLRAEENHPRKDLLAWRKSKLYSDLNLSEFSQTWRQLIPRIGLRKTQDLDLVVFAECLNNLRESKETLRPSQIIMGPNWTEKSFSPRDFFIWKSGGEPEFPDTKLYEIFLEIEEHFIEESIRCHDTFKVSDRVIGQDKPLEGAHLAVFLLSGGQVDLDHCIVYQSGGDIFDDMSSSDEVGCFGLLGFDPGG
jgi:hypothetical protein